MPPWLSESLRLLPAAAIVTAFVWGYFKLFLARKIDDAITEKVNGHLKQTVAGQEKLEEDLGRGLNSVRRDHRDLERVVYILVGRSQRVDAALLSDLGPVQAGAREVKGSGA